MAGSIIFEQEGKRIAMSRRGGNGLDEQTNAALDAVAGWRKRQPPPAPVALVFFNPPEDPVETACLATAFVCSKAAAAQANFLGDHASSSQADLPTTKICAKRGERNDFRVREVGDNRCDQP